MADGLASDPLVVTSNGVFSLPWSVCIDEDDFLLFD